MIKGVGIDIIEIGRVEKALSNNKRFIDRVFTNIEKEYIESRNGNINTIAGLFAAKEAISKALGSGIRNFKWTDLEIDHDTLGKPYVNLRRDAKELSHELGIEDIQLSISHSNDNAISYCIAQGSKTNLDTDDKIDRMNINPLTEKFITEDKLNSFTIINKDLTSKLLPERNLVSHKGNYGRVGVIAGSIGMTGAAYLTAQASLRSGSGLVYAVTPKSLTNIMEIKTTEIIIKPVKDNDKGHFIIDALEDIKSIVSNFNVIALGPGLGIDSERIKVVEEIIKFANIPIVLDGDGLNCISRNEKALLDKKAEIVITPHPGELARLLNKSIEEIQKDRVKNARIASKKFGVITVLKGANTVICDKECNIYINTSGNPGMATAGSGDVLTGVITSFIGQNIKMIDSVIAGVYIHGLAGDLAAYGTGTYGLTASDIIKKLPNAIKSLGGV
ncbi:NAD(P)H-hydrate dehydratase [Sporosalibacterium faouarense]|uniref:NAD(P)H-hydrate dehydratase n=1 Tax=Sporosalibacterium faouarense TaxID=516123 RepID=UPI00192AD7FC|nr:NAD(P)H-hydrate dehydratase [Sporosalibacterium faouarense]